MIEKLERVDDPELREILVGLQPLEGNIATVKSTRDGQFLVEGDRLFFNFSAGTNDWREIQFK